MKNEKKITNQRVLLCYLIIISVLAVSYLIEYFKGARSITYIVLFWTALFLPYAVTFLRYKKTPDADIIRYYVLGGCSIFYLIALFTASSSMAFVYILPPMTAMALYRNGKFCLIAGGIVCAMNAIIILLKLLSGKVSHTDIVDFETQLACVILVAVFMYITAKTINEIFESKMHLLVEKQEIEKDNFQRVLDTTNHICTQVTELSKEASNIEDQSCKSQTSMVKITEVTMEASDNMKQQIEMGEQINHMSHESLKLAIDSQQMCTRTMENTKVGAANMNELSEVSNESKDACNIVSDTIHQLNHKMQEANDILSMIENITKKTSLLSLNASIEAARAGEAGNGFAVVANDIQNLAVQTKSATEEIKSILSSLVNYNKNAVDAVIRLEEVHGRQIHLIDHSKENFSSIESEMDHVIENVDLQTEQIQKLDQYNERLRENAQNVNTFVDNLAVTAKDTNQMTEDNLYSIKRMNELLTDVLQEVKKLGSQL